MKANNAFGIYLKHLMALRNMRSSELAKKINVDASLIRKWISGSRIPSFRSNYIQLIFEALKLTPEEVTTLRKMLVSSIDSSIIQPEEKTQHFSKGHEALLFEHNVDAILLTYPDGAIISANRAACSLFQMSESDLCTAGRQGIIDLAYSDLYPFLQERELRGSIKTNLPFIKKDGTRFWADVTSAVYLNCDGQPESYVLIKEIEQRPDSQEGEMK